MCGQMSFEKQAFHVQIPVWNVFVKIFGPIILFSVHINTKGGRGRSPMKEIDGEKSWISMGNGWFSSFVMDSSYCCRNIFADPAA